MREALFSSLEHRLGGLADLRVLDLFAGSGALGLEALSRGAATVVLIERDRRSADAIRHNVEAVALPGAQVLVGDVLTLTAVPSARGAFDLVLMDPPYSLSDADVEAVLRALARHGWLVPGATVVVERAAGSAFAWPEGFGDPQDRDYGGTVLRQALWYGPERAEGGVSGFLRPDDERSP